MGLLGRRRPRAPHVKCFAMIRNEVDLIADWLRHHLDLFGDGNVHVLDHASDDGTEAVLRRFAGRITVTPTDGPFTAKAQLLTELARRHRAECELMLFLDADEFVGRYYSLDREAILASLAALDRRRHGMFTFGHDLLAVLERADCTDPLIEMTSFLHRDCGAGAKTFFSARTFIEVSPGQHGGASRRAATRVSPLVLWHYPLRSAAQLRRKVLRGAQAYRRWTSGTARGWHWKAAWELLDGGADWPEIAVAMYPRRTLNGQLAPVRTSAMAEHIQSLRAERG